MLVGWYIDNMKTKLLERVGLRPYSIGRVVYIGSLDKLPIFCEINYENQKLSITGVIDPKSNGNADHCGQIYDTIKDNIDIIKYAKGWNKIKTFQFVEYWKEWHLNHMQAGCEHQREKNWSSNDIGKVCKVCKYGYGTRWLHKDVPTDVLNWLDNLPEKTKDPVWI